MTSRERLIVAFRCGTPDRIPVAPQGFGRISRTGSLGRELVAKTGFTLYAGGGVNPFIGNPSQIEVLRNGDTRVAACHLPTGDFKGVSKWTVVTSACVEFLGKKLENDGRSFSGLYIPPTEEQIRQAAQNFISEKDWFGEESVTLHEVSGVICFPAEWFSLMNCDWKVVDRMSSFCWEVVGEVQEQTPRISGGVLLW